MGTDESGLEKQIEALERSLRTLERRVNRLEKEEALPEPKPVPSAEPVSPPGPLVPEPTPRSRSSLPSRSHLRLRERTSSISSNFSVAGFLPGPEALRLCSERSSS